VQEMSSLDERRWIEGRRVQRFRVWIVAGWGVLVGGTLIANYVPGLGLVGSAIALTGFVLQLVAAVLIIRHTRGPREPYPLA
jgi:hypothetical protein